MHDLADFGLTMQRVLHFLGNRKDFLVSVKTPVVPVSRNAKFAFVVASDFLEKMINRVSRL
jgi:hypothetical protein